jgi:hypothetical protein
MSSMTGPLKTTAKREGSSTSYTVSVPTWNFNPLLKPRDGIKAVSTVVRHGGTSAKLFRDKLSNGGWASWGESTQPAEGKPDVTGNVADEQPDARTLFLAGGVEVLQVTVPASSGIKIGPKAKAWIFFRSPADVFFYSGHGAWWDCTLLREQAGHTYDSWLDPETIVDAWQMGRDVHRSPWDINVLVINGCSVIGTSHLSSDDGTKPACYRRWQKLLISENKLCGLYAILGYRGTAPLDSIGGDQIAVEMAQAMVKSLGTNWKAYAPKWLEINAKYPLTRTAAAIDTAGYWYINLKQEPA